MKEKISDAIIRFCGFVSIIESLYISFLADKSNPIDATMIFVQLLIFVPPLFLLGWRVCAKRLWAGICLALFVGILCSNFITSRQSFSLLAGFNFILFIALTLMLTLFSSRWKRAL